jgi:hypothetical protein
MENHRNFDQATQDLNISIENYCCNNLLNVKTTVFWDVTLSSLVDGSSKTVVTTHQTALHHIPETHSLKKIYPTNIT